MTKKIIEAKKIKKRGIVFDIERYAINDGPGIRTVVFMKGCPLRCLWCANPESHKKNPELVYWENKCLRCGRCIEACPNEALRQKDGVIHIYTEKCNMCGQCTNVCNAQALNIIGSEMTPFEVLEKVLQDEIFFQDSRGGVTFSGGEPFEQTEFLMECAALCKQNDIHTCVETSGMTRWEDIEKTLPYIDLILYDFKHMQNKIHKQLTGSSNELILNNFKRVAALNKDMVIRIPVIPTINDTEENYSELISFLKEYPGYNCVDLLPYHRLGLSKYKRMKIDYHLIDLLPPSKKRMEEIKNLFEKNGFQVTIGG